MTQEEHANGTSTSGAIVAVGAVQSATSHSDADLSAIKQIATQTKAIGVILPPPDIRAIVDKTANFVARNGKEFEKRILLSEQNNPKFNFLKPADPYHAYYETRVKDLSEPEAAPDGAAAPKAAEQVMHSLPPLGLLQSFTRWLNVDWAVTAKEKQRNRVLFNGKA